MKIYAGDRPPNLSPGWVQKHWRAGYRVRVDGEVVTQVIAASTDDRKVWRHRDEMGTDGPQIEVIEGQVEIEAI